MQHHIITPETQHIRRTAWVIRQLGSADRKENVCHADRFIELIALDMFGIKPKSDCHLKLSDLLIGNWKEEEQWSRGHTTHFQTLDIFLFFFFWQESTVHAVLYPRGRTVNLCQHASMQQSDAIATLLPTWCKLVQAGSVQQAIEKQINPHLLWLFLSFVFHALPSSFVSLTLCDSLVMFKTSSFHCASVWMPSCNECLAS